MGNNTPSHNLTAVPLSNTPGLKYGPNGTVFFSSGIPELDKILGGGFALGSLVMVMEDAEASHHMLLLRNSMSQGLSIHPKGFLGTLPSPRSCKVDKDKSRDHDPEQYKYFDGKHEYCNDFDLRKPLERHFLSGRHIDCVSILHNSDLVALRDHCATFFTQFSRNDGSIASAGHIAIQSFCAPQCEYSNVEWDMLSFIRSLRSMIRSSNAVAVVTFPPSLLLPSVSERWQHMADTLLSVRAIPDEDKELANLLTGYQDMVGLLNIHRVARVNTQMIFIYTNNVDMGMSLAVKENYTCVGKINFMNKTNSISIKQNNYLLNSVIMCKTNKRPGRFLVLECLNQAPIDGASGNSYGTSASCSSSSKTGTHLDF
ncbi:hypothetical protein I3842_Q015400 [Carya illinoinensis]|uniref:Elongator complex protein 4 n=1 Tax=Carya illinoinensis TaxID=32201 RepID=A0A921ZZ15_CARIL|nr:hypothetical protein I3842_Q015400 [Carya illinoinensis]